MKYLAYYISMLWIGCISTHYQSQSNSDMVNLKDRIVLELSRVPGKFAVAFENPDTGEELSINEKANFHAASTMKTPVMIEVFKQVKEGNVSLEDSFLIRNRFKSVVDGSEYSLDPGSDSQTGLYKKIGEKSTLYDLMYQMIIQSSNLATNLIIELLDAKKITHTMRTLGAGDILVLRGVEDQKAYDLGLSNTTTALDLVKIYTQIANGTAIDEKSCKKMINILSDQKLNSIIPAKLPEGLRIAHKTGSITGVFHDAGIVYLPDGRKYVLVLLSAEVTDEKAAIEALSNVSKIIYDSVKGSSK